MLLLIISYVLFCLPEISMDSITLHMITKKIIQMDNTVEI